MRPFLLCSLVAVVSADNCECVSATRVATEGVPFFPDSYGAGCAAYDATYNVIPECSSASKPAWCYRQWCYVNVSCFNVFHPSHHFVGEIVRSYTACGELPLTFFGSSLEGNYISSETAELEGTTVRAFMLNNTGGWKGSFLDADGHNVLEYGSHAHGDSPFVAFAKSLATVGEDRMRTQPTYTPPPRRPPPGPTSLSPCPDAITKLPVSTMAGRFSMEYIDRRTPLPDEVLAQLDAQNQTGHFSACALGTSLNLWDICIGEMWVTKERAAYSKFLPAVTCTPAAPDICMPCHFPHTNLSISLSPSCGT